MFNGSEQIFKSLNTSKTELVIFKPKNKIITKHLNFRISGQKIKPSPQVKYLEIILQDDLQVETKKETKKETSRSTGLLSKVRHYVPKHLLRTIYHSISSSHLKFGDKTKQATTFKSYCAYKKKRLE